MADEATTLNLDFDPEDLTLGELDDFETVAEVSLFEVMGTKNISAKALLALVWVLQRRSDKSFTLDDARGVKVGALEWPDDDEDEDVEGDDESPTDPANG